VWYIDGMTMTRENPDVPVENLSQYHDFDIKTLGMNKVLRGDKPL
jgi:hypothetical protein